MYVKTEKNTSALIKVKKERKKKKKGLQILSHQESKWPLKLFDLFLPLEIIVTDRVKQGCRDASYQEIYGFQEIFLLLFAKILFIFSLFRVLAKM